MNEIKILGIAVMVLGIFVAMDMVIERDNEPEVVPCYDRFSNEIIDEYCIKEPIGIITIIGVLFLFEVLGFALYGVGDVSDGLEEAGM